ncbi:pyridoxal phosphate-dependent aminotransferase [Nocardia huaxiensis]|uniref:pyridoxal phosphate-dependent aminotransferase n=1 Tax=Nocardia huaxiensis TaxID=2755382 RepID=UPI001E4862E1|nr:pyridoxal phosphate-dependent aminotransferase [Nocardia huaxiensis]UFT00027.1 pyridoxal phosphate-dependent aminotransferase [Nocardia huaxiensis]
MGSVDHAKLRHHGDAEVRPGMVDFAVNVQGSAPPEWLRERLAARLGELGRYPDAGEEQAAREAVAARHGRRPEEVLLLAGAAEGFAMLPRLNSALAAVIHPSFTEPELALRDAGVPVARVVLEPPYLLESAFAAATETSVVAEAGRPAVAPEQDWQLRVAGPAVAPEARAGSAPVEAGVVPEAADLVVVGNPTNPTSVLHPVQSILGLRRPGRIVVVDEAFQDAIPGETESLAGEAYPDVLVLRSLTKTWALAGLRCGYFLGDPEVLARLNQGRAHWPLGTLQLEAIAATSSPEAVAESQRKAESIAADRDAMIPRLRELGIEVHEPARGPFLLIRVPDAELLRKRLADKGIAVRRGDTFPGLELGHLRLAVRPAGEVDRLVAAIREVGL